MNDRCNVKFQVRMTNTQISIFFYTSNLPKYITHVVLAHALIIYSKTHDRQDNAMNVRSLIRVHFCMKATPMKDPAYHIAVLIDENVVKSSIVHCNCVLVYRYKRPFVPYSVNNARVDEATVMRSMALL